MDLVAGIRKEGSRGGRDSFKWSDVKESSHRENYLGHSLMAPVGRWQQGRDLNWYAKNKDGDSQQHERNEELRRIKEAEQDAMARALGLPVAPRSSNANMTPLGGNEVRKAIQESTDADDKDEAGRGIGFGSYGGLAMDDAEGDTLAAIGIDSQPRSREQEEGRSFRGHPSRRDRSRDTDRRRERNRDRDHRDRGTRHRKDRDAYNPDRSEHRYRHHREHREHRRHRSPTISRSRSPKRDHRHRHREENRDRTQTSDTRREHGRHERRRSYSPRPDRPDRGIEKDGKHSNHHTPVDRLHESRRGRDFDRSHRDHRR